MLTYKTLEMKESEASADAEDGTKKPVIITLHKIESMKKIIKSHHAALDLDKEFIMNSVTSADFNFEEEVELVDNKKVAGKKRKLKNK